MLTYKRYSCMGFHEDRDGDFIRYADVAALLKELEQFRKHEKARKDSLQKEVKAFDEFVIREIEKRKRHAAHT